MSGLFANLLALGRRADAEREPEQLKTPDGDTKPYLVAVVYAQWGNAVLTASFSWKYIHRSMAKARPLNSISV